MFDSGVNGIKELLISFLGDPKNEGSGTQLQFCCPCCAEHKCVESDGKFNLEVNIEKGVYHCWVCEESDGTRGKISHLIKKYGNPQILKEYYNIIKSIKESSLYSLYGGGKFDDDEIINDDDDFELPLPYGYTPITKEDPKAKEAYDYLINRGLNDWFIKTYKLGYIGENVRNPWMRNRIIIPSYGLYGDLNYWVGRDYKGDSKLRYKNPKIEKTKFIFNEKLVNWYENVTLVEGVFDHMVVPNSIPLLGKVLNKKYVLYDMLNEYARANVNIFLDCDAIENAKKLYKFLDNGNLKGRVRLIVCPDGEDASSIFQKEGREGIVRLMKQPVQIDEFDLLSI